MLTVRVNKDDLDMTYEKIDDERCRITGSLEPSGRRATFFLVGKRKIANLICIVAAQGSVAIEIQNYQLIG